MPRNFTKHVLLIIGDVPMNHREEIKSDHPGVRQEVFITAAQACADIYTVGCLVSGADDDQPATDAEIRQYFMILTGGQPPETVGAVVIDEASWLNEDNMFINGPRAMFRDGTPLSIARPIGILERV